MPGFPVGTPYNDGLGHSWGYRIGSSVIAGGTLGYNWQVGQLVVGIEGELGYIRRRGSAKPRRGCTHRQL